MSTRSACRGIPGRLAGLLVLATLTGLAAGPPAAAEVRRFFAVSGPVSVSVDAGGSVFGSHSIAVDKPSGTATVLVAFVFAASHSFRVIADGDVSIDDVPIAWSGAALTTLPNRPGIFYNVLADVTEVVAPKVDAAAPGLVTFAFGELGGTTIDGEILAVVFEDPEQTVERTVWLAFGGSSAEADSFLVTLKDPIDPELPGALADFGLGISASSSLQGPITGRNVLVDSVRITSAAGGEDDGGTTAGSRITVGGVGDGNANPPDPLARPEADPRYDDELYDLLPYFAASRSRYRVTTLLGEGTDNFFFAYFVFSEFTALDSGIFLDPETAANEVGGEHTLTATAFDRQGRPAVGVEVTFDVFAGPNAGVTGAGKTDADGVATFTYTGDGGPGVDSVEASFFDEREDRVFSNVAETEWLDVAVEVSLTPETAAREVGETHSVTATVTRAAAAAVDVTVDFAVKSGPNAGVGGSGVTGGDGAATFAYAGLGGAGTDVIVASVVDSAGEVQTSNEVTVEWTVPVLAEPRPDIAADDDDTILVVGEVGAGLLDVMAAFLDGDGALTAAFTVNEETGFHRSPATDALAEGGFAVAFVAGRGAANALLGRLIDVAGPLGGAFTIAAADPSCDLPEDACAVASPDVAARPGGGFAVVWEQEGSIFGRLYEAGGAAAGDAFVVAAGTAESLRLEPAVAVLADGSVAVAYTAVEVGSGQIPLVFDEIRLARFDAGGALMADVGASRYNGGLQAHPTVTAAGGRPFAFWESFSDDATGAGIFGRLDPEDAGRPELQVNSAIAGDQLWPAAAVEASGLVAVAWLDAPENALAAQRLAPGLAYVDDELAVTPTVFLGVTGEAPVFGRTRVAALADGTLVVAAAVAGTAADPDGGVAVGFAAPSPLADCFEDGRLICVKVAVGR